MKQWLIVVGIILILAILAVAAGAVMAQEPDDPGGATPGWGFGAWGSRGGFGPMGGAWGSRGGFGPMGGAWGGRGGFGPMGGDAWGGGRMRGGRGGFGPMGGAWGSRGGFGPMGGAWGGAASSPVTVIADELGMTPADLVKEVQAGKTVAEVAAEHEVTLEKLVDALVTPRSETLAQLVENGRLTQEQADAQVALMKANVTAWLNETWSARGCGAGLGFVDENGDGVCDYRQGPPAAPEQQ